jgi:serine/threonine protein kinase/Tfp pilus assembly protein PilF
MISAPRVCPQCGAEIPSDAPEGGCPCCLLHFGLLPDARDASTITATEADEGGSAENVEVNAAAAAGHSKKAQHAAGTVGELGDYELLKVVGRGGQGVVYRAHQKSLNRTVALKMISVGSWATEAHLKRFRREAEAAASLEHPGIVPIHEVGESDGSWYFSMRFVEGGQLDQVIKREPMSIRQAAELISKVARTVHYAHEHGILHRDIKPGNILLDAKGEPLLTDFGLARLVEAESTVTRTKEVMGTPSYMAPEQAVGNNAAVNSATDVYGLGAVLYQLLTGHPPFAGGTTYETIKLVLDTEPRQPRSLNPKIDRDLSTICLKCLEKDPKRRYSSALALAEDLERWLKHEPILARRTGLFTRGRKWVRRNPSTAVLITLLVALAAGSGVVVWNRVFAVPMPKSIAVLPFSNLSKEEQNAYFADGVQDQILTDLSQIADLKVISRTSVMQYKSGVARNLRKIAAELGVAHVLEGSVQRAANKIRVSAQLIDARTDAHLWAQTYDRDMADVFAIQSEIAKAIAEQLQAKLSPNEKAAIEKPPTTDLAAFDLYTRAKTLLLSLGFTVNFQQPLHQAIELLNQAVGRDPSFFEAYYQLVFAHGYAYSASGDHTSAQLASAEAALQAVTRLRPDAGETHLARANYLYRCLRDYNGALAELEVARRSLPNDPRLFELTGYILRRRGQQEEGIRNLERAVELDPRNSSILQQLALSYSALRRYPESAAVLDRALTIIPNDAATRTGRAGVDFDWKAETRPLHETINSILAAGPAAISDAASDWFVCALAERDPKAAERALVALGDNPCWHDGPVILSRTFGEGLLARMMKDEARAQAAFSKARLEQEKIVQAQPDYGPPLCVLGLIDAALGRKEDALREGRRAIELLPVEKDSIFGSRMLVYFAMIAAWVGEKDLALQYLAANGQSQGGYQVATYGVLKLHPFWDPLRGDPRFEKIVASLAPKEK